MVAKAVLINLPANQVSRTMRLGGTTVVRNWADNTTFYTVPAGKKLTLKMPYGGGGQMIATADSAGIPTVVFSTSSPLQYQPMSYVLPAGTILQSTGQVGVFTGFLDDDV